jgi:hypothetical protein
MLRTSFIAGFAVAALLGATPFVIPADHMEGGTMIIPGHGRLSDVAALDIYQQMISPDGTIVPAGKVPNFLPGKNDILGDFATEYGIPLEAALGGSETLYPEYHKKLKTMKVAPRTTTEHYRRAQ